MTAGISKARPILLGVIVTVVAVFGALVALLTFKLRSGLREQVLRREATAIQAVALMQLQSAPTKTAEVAGADVTQEMFAAVLESSRLRGVLAVQLFDVDGALRDALPAVSDPAPRWWPPELTEPLARFQAAAPLESVYGLAPETGSNGTLAPLLEVVVPLHADLRGGAKLGVAHYWIDGSDLSAEFRTMDRHLAWPVLTFFLVGAGAVTLVLIWAFRRLETANRRLQAQSDDLARANQELDTAAKIGAIGAISAHLMHGLKNPLAGLEGFASDHARAAADSTHGAAWRDAWETTRRLRTIVNEVVAVIRDEGSGTANYRVPAPEIVESARHRQSAAAGIAGVNLSVSAPADLSLPARTANLANLVLANLIANAIEASPRGATVAIEARASDEGVEFLVRDAGPGVPTAVVAGLFQPLRSTKPGGGGVGLTISKRLARHAQGRLELIENGESGAVFRLWVPGAEIDGQR